MYIIFDNKSTLTKMIFLLTMTTGRQAIAKSITVMLCGISHALLCHIVNPGSTMFLLGAAPDTVCTRGVTTLPCKQCFCLQN